MVFVRSPIPSSDRSPILSGKRTPVFGSATSSARAGAAEPTARPAIIIDDTTTAATCLTRSPPLRTIRVRSSVDVAERAQALLLLGTQADRPSRAAAAARAPALQRAASDRVRDRGRGHHATAFGRIERE